MPCNPGHLRRDPHRSCLTMEVVALAVCLEVMCLGDTKPKPRFGNLLERTSGHLETTCAKVIWPIVPCAAFAAISAIGEVCTGRQQRQRLIKRHDVSIDH